MGPGDPSGCTGGPPSLRANRGLRASIPRQGKDGDTYESKVPTATMSGSQQAAALGDKRKSKGKVPGAKKELTGPNTCAWGTGPHPIRHPTTCRGLRAEEYGALLL